MNPSEYEILVEEKDIDGVKYFVGRVTELPGIEVFEDTHLEAVIACSGIILDLNM